MNHPTNLVLLLGLLVACGGATTPVGGAIDAGSAQVPRGPAGAVVADGGSGPGIDAHPGGTTSNLPCGSATCRIPTESCCVVDPGNGPSYSCVVGTLCPSPHAVSNSGTVGQGATGTNNGNGPTVVTLQCGGAANCPDGEVCCAQTTDNATSSTCKQVCNANEVQLCDPSAAVTRCPTVQPCTTSGASDLGLPASFGACGEGGGASSGASN
jgi:hypothetical protein